MKKYKITFTRDIIRTGVYQTVVETNREIAGGNKSAYRRKANEFFNSLPPDIINRALRIDEDEDETQVTTHLVSIEEVKGE